MYKTPKWLLQLPIDSRNLTESSSLVLPTPQTFGLEKGQRSSVSLTVTWTVKDMSLLKEQPTNRRAGRFAGRTSFARPSNRWICSASTQNSATCPQVPPAGTRAGLWAGRPVGALHTQMNELSTSNTSAHSTEQNLSIDLENATESVPQIAGKVCLWQPEFAMDLLSVCCLGHEQK